MTQEEWEGLVDEAHRNAHGFRTFIRRVVGKYPDLLQSVLAAANCGLQDAIEAANKRALAYNIAFQCSLALPGAKKVDAYTQNSLNEAIKKVINHHSPTGLEVEYLKSIGEEDVDS